MRTDVIGQRPRWVACAFVFRRGKCGIILLVVVLVAGYYGGFNRLLLTGQPVSQQQSTRSISPNDDEAAKFYLGDPATTEDTGATLFQNGRGYQQPKLA